MRNKEKEYKIAENSDRCAFGPLEDMRTAVNVMAMLSNMLSVETEKIRIVFEYDPEEERFYVYQE